MNRLIRAITSGILGWMTMLVVMASAPILPADAPGLYAGMPDTTEQPGPVRSHLQGMITVRPEVDSTQNYTGFEVLIFDRPTATASADTLGYAMTDSTGAFETNIVAPRRGVYPIVISRLGTVLKVDNMVVAEADSARMRVQVPMGERPIAIRSRENAAWMAFQNTRAQYNQSLLQLLQTQGMSDSSMAATVGQTGAIYWNLYTTYPGTIGGSLAAGEAITLLAGWDDPRVVAYMQELEIGNPRLVDAVRAARKAQARLEGQEAAIALVESFRDRVDEAPRRAALQSELVIARMDSAQHDLAIEAAEALLAMDEPQWEAWASDALYELRNLMPGMEAPTFSAVTREGEAFDLADLQGTKVLLEFYVPEDNAYRGELGVRDSLVTAWTELPLQTVSISLQPDTLLNEALFDGRSFPGVHIFDPQSFDGEAAQAYGVRNVPTRYIIDEQGRIVQKYIGSGAWGLIAELLTEGNE